MTETIAAAARGVAGAGTEIVAVTSSMGPASIEGYYDEALAVPGLLMEIAAGERAGAQAAIIACFDDTGLDAARAMAAHSGHRHLRGRTRHRLLHRPALHRRDDDRTLACARRGAGAALRHGGRARVRAADIPVLALEDPASGAVEKLRAEIARAIEEDRAEAIVLGCAGMADLAHRLQAEFGLPVIDGVGAAVKQAEALIALGLSTSKRGAYASPLAKPYRGMLKSFSPGMIAAE